MTFTTEKLLVAFILLMVPFNAVAQQVKGKVTNAAGEPLQSASITWINSKKGTVTNNAGEFNINLPKKTPGTLLISFAGYKTDSLEVTDTSFLFVSLTEKNALKTITVQVNKKPFYIAANPIKTEVITSLELKKAACCDLAGCFETQASVQPQTTNIITNSKELRILGLSGI